MPGRQGKHPFCYNSQSLIFFSVSSTFFWKQRSHTWMYSGGIIQHFPILVSTALCFSLSSVDICERPEMFYRSLFPLAFCKTLSLKLYQTIRNSAPLPEFLSAEGRGKQMVVKGHCSRWCPFFLTVGDAMVCSQISPRFDVIHEE